MVSAQARHKCILVVEDDFVLAELLSHLLGAGGGYRVCTAGNGDEAAARGRGRDKPDLILLDLRMPRKDGFAFLQERRDDEVLSSIPVVIVTGADVVAHELTALGASECLHKPLDPIALLQAVRRYCG